MTACSCCCCCCCCCCWLLLSASATAASSWAPPHLFAHGAALACSFVLSRHRGARSIIVIIIIHHHLSSLSSSSQSSFSAVEGAEPTVEKTDADADASGDEEDGNGPKKSRVEKKARRLLSKLGLKPVPGVSRVTIKKAKNVIIAIASPDVFKMPSSDTYIVFGEAQADDPNEAAKRSAAQQLFQKQAAAAASGGSADDDDDDDEMPDLAPAEGASAGASEDGLLARDIELVVQQSNKSRAEAVAALKKNDGDIVNAIMDLSM